MLREQERTLPANTEKTHEELSLGRSFHNGDIFPEKSGNIALAIALRLLYRFFTGLYSPL